MLVLSRKQNETIVVPHLNLTIRVAAISGNRVRLALEAPQNVPIIRNELCAKESRRSQSLSGDHPVLA